MTMRSVSCFLAFCMVAGISLNAQAGAKVKSKTYFKLVEAYTQRTLAGRPGSPPTTGMHFIIIWQGAKYPETFFWRGEGGWLSCNMQKAHKLTGKPNTIPRGMEYRTEFVTGNDIHKGDTLELSPVTGGRFPIPAEIPESAKNTLYFKTGGSGWLSFPVKNITKKPDISMP